MKISIELATEKAIQIVIMDAIEKGHTDKNELIAYMQSDAFSNAVQNYVALFNQAS